VKVLSKYKNKQIIGCMDEYRVYEWIQGVWMNSVCMDECSVYGWIQCVRMNTGCMDEYSV